MCPVAAQGALRVGTITDGPWDRDQRVLATFKSKIAESLRGTRDVQFPDEKQLHGDWTTRGARAALNQLLADPEVEIIVTLGLVSSYEAATRRALDKPVIATRVIAPDLLKIPSRQVGEELSGVPNLSYLSLNLNLGREIEAYREVVPFRRLAFLTQKVLEGSHLTEFQSKVIRDFQSRGFETTFLTVEDSVESTLATLPEDVEAVLLGGMPHLTDAAFEQLVRGLIDRKLPSFSLVGQRDVQRGALAGLKRDRNEQRTDQPLDQDVSNRFFTVSGTP